jgi:hypothetical protein
LPQELLRFHAIEAPLPVFPAHFGPRDFQGRVVVNVVVPERGGSIASLKVLESSDPSLVTVTESALARWRFSSFANTQDVSHPAAVNGLLLSTWLVFYFTVKDGQQHITDAAFEMLERDRKRYGERQRKAGLSREQPR